MIGFSFRRFLRSVLYPFHRIRSIVESVNFMGLSESGKELLLTLAVLGRLPSNYTAIPRIVSSVLGTPTRSKASFYEQVRVLRKKGLVRDSGGFIELTTKGLMVAGKYVVLVRMIYTVPMTITLLLLLTVLRPWTPWWFLYAGTIVAILHHVSNLVVILMKPLDYGLHPRFAGLVRLLPESMPILLSLTIVWRKITDPVEASVEALNIVTMRARRRVVKMVVLLRGFVWRLLGSRFYT